MFRNYILFFLLFYSFFSIAQNNSLQQKLDSIQSLRKLSRASNIDLETKLVYARDASILSEETRIDTTILKSNLNLSFRYLDLDKGNLYKNINLKNLKLAVKLNDSSAIANVNYGLGYYYAQEAKTDSAYYHFYNAEKVFRALGKIQSEGEILLNLADIQETTRDYTGSEETAIRAISLIETLPTTERNLDTLWALYNLLAVISARLELHDDAIKNYESCIEIANKMSQPLYYVLNSRNNMASSYGDKGDCVCELDRP